MALDQKKEALIIAECKRLGEQLPARIRDAPTIPDYMAFYIEAFFDLSTDRQTGFGVGPIPNSSIVNYCVRLDMDTQEERDFNFFIRRMDKTYLDYQERKSKANKGKCKK